MVLALRQIRWTFKKSSNRNVIIEDDVDIGACTTIDRATMGSTIIRKGVKLQSNSGWS
jgi:UDP-3-O-[3-hydroxymyristoyl] glucosamine N-acyltransferase